MSWSFRPCTAQGGRSDGPIQQIDARSSRPGPDHALCLSGPGSTRHAEPTHPQSSPVRDLWLFGGIWNDLCRRAGLDRDAQTSIKRRHEPKDGDNHGRFSDSVVYYGLLIASRLVILWNVVAVLVNFLSVGAYLHFVRK